MSMTSAAKPSSSVHNQSIVHDALSAEVHQTDVAGGGLSALRPGMRKGSREHRVDFQPFPPHHLHDLDLHATNRFVPVQS